MCVFLGQRCWSVDVGVYVVAFGASMVTCSEDIPQNKERSGGDGEYKQEAILQTTRLAMFSPCSPSLLEGHARPTTRPHHQCCCLPAPPRRFTFISPESKSRQAPLTHTSRQWTVQINGRPVGTDRQPPWRALSAPGGSVIQSARLAGLAGLAGTSRCPAGDCGGGLTMPRWGGEIAGGMEIGISFD